MFENWKLVCYSARMVVRCILNFIKSLGNCLSLLWEVTQATRVVVIPSMPKCLILNICGEKICNISCIYLMRFKDVCFLNIFAGFCIDICALSWIMENNTTKNTKHTKKDFDDNIPFQKCPLQEMDVVKWMLHNLGVSGLNCLSLH